MKFILINAQLALTILVFSAFVKCKGQEEKPLPIINDCESLLAVHKNNFFEELAYFQKTYLPDENTQNYTWKYNFGNNKIKLFKNENPYLSIDFIHVGSINVPENTWTWSWANLQETETNKLQKVKAFGVANNCEKLKQATWSGIGKSAWELVGISNYLLSGKGGARHYTKTEYNYVVFTKIEKL